MIIYGWKTTINFANSSQLISVFLSTSDNTKLIVAIAETVLFEWHKVSYKNGNLFHWVTDEKKTCE